MKLRLVERIMRNLPDIDENDGELVVRLLNNPQYFPNQALVQSIKFDLINAIADKGLDVTKNPMLFFALDSSNKDLGKINSNYANILYNEFRREHIKFNDRGKRGSNIEEWIFNPKAYDLSEYKLRSLIILSTPNELKRFVSGDKLDVENRPIKKVLEAKTDEEIVKILDDYAPDTEEEAEDKELEGDPEKNKEKFFKYFRPLVSKDIKDADLNKIIEKGLKKATGLQQLQAVVLKEVAKVLNVDLK